ncbi:MAG: integrase core domain-containing protein [Congregibacter sp.]
MQPGKPTQNAFVKSVNGKFREYCLKLHWFTSVQDAKTQSTVSATTTTTLDHIVHWEKNRLRYLLRRRPDMLHYPPQARLKKSGTFNPISSVFPVNCEEFDTLASNAIKLRDAKTRRHMTCSRASKKARGEPPKSTALPGSEPPTKRIRRESGA